VSRTDDKVIDIILAEVRLNRKEIKELRRDISVLRARFAIIAVLMGLAGGKVSTLLPFL